MAQKLLTEAVTETADGSWEFRCPVNDGSCGTRGGPSFSSSGWPTKKAATERGAQHFADHKSALPDGEEFTMPELHAFRVEAGLAADPAHLVTAKEL